MSECTHDCSTCTEKCDKKGIEKEKQNDFSNIKKVIGVVSGKGGVGKSLVTSLLAVGFNKKGYIIHLTFKYFKLYLNIQFPF